MKKARASIESRRRLAVSKEIANDLFELSPDAISITRLSDGTYMEVNRGFTELFGFAREEIVGHSSLPEGMALWVRDEDRQGLVRNLRKAGDVSRIESEFRRKDGTVITGLLSSRIVEVEGERYLLTIGRDITTRKLAERSLASFSRIQAIVNGTTQLILRERDEARLLEGACRIAVDQGGLRMAWIGIVDEGTDLARPAASAGAVDGYLDDIRISRAEEPAWEGPTGKALRELTVAVCADIERDESMAPWREMALARAYRSSAAFPLRSSSRPTALGVVSFYSGETGFFGEREIALLSQLVLDISFALESIRAREFRDDAEKRLRDSETRFRTAFADAPVGMAMVDIEGRFLETNKAFQEMLGRSSAEFVSRPFADFTHVEDLAASDAAVRSCLSGARKSSRLVKRYLHKDGRAVWSDVSVSLMRDEAGGPQAFLVHMLDVGERMQYEERLQLLVRQEEVLMKELQHRVKNNLSVVAGLLRLESSNCEEESARQRFAAAVARVDSIAGIYERLSHSEDGSSVDLGPYVANVSKSLFQTYNLDPSRVRLRVDADSVRLDTKRCVPLGLVLNELVTNALKYAYPGDARGDVRVELKVEGERVRLTVSDDGVGLAEPPPGAEAKSLGMTLVRMLSEQLEAELSICGAKGTRASLSFKA